VLLADNFASDVLVEAEAIKAEASRDAENRLGAPVPALDQAASEDVSYFVKLVRVGQGVERAGLGSESRPGRSDSGEFGRHGTVGIARHCYMDDHRSGTNHAKPGIFVAER
jgi:hypothetical protein